jgi:hypothetical protein
MMDCRDELLWVQNVRAARIMALRRSRLREHQLYFAKQLSRRPYIAPLRRFPEDDTHHPQIGGARPRFVHEKVQRHLLEYKPHAVAANASREAGARQQRVRPVDKLMRAMERSRSGITYLEAQVIAAAPVASVRLGEVPMRENSQPRTALTYSETDQAKAAPVVSGRREAVTRALHSRLRKYLASDPFAFSVALISDDELPQEHRQIRPIVTDARGDSEEAQLEAELTMLRTKRRHLDARGDSEEVHLEAELTMLRAKRRHLDAAVAEQSLLRMKRPQIDVQAHAREEKDAAIAWIEQYTAGLPKLTPLSREPLLTTANARRKRSPDEARAQRAALQRYHKLHSREARLAEQKEAIETRWREESGGAPR